MTLENLWFDELPEVTRENLFAVMRALGNKETAHARRFRDLCAPHGTIAVGSAHMDEWIDSLAIAIYLKHLRKIKPILALEAATIELSNATKKHNSHRPNEINWQRNPETWGMSILGYAHKQVLDVLEL